MHRGMVAMRRGFHSEAVDRFKVAYDFYVERGFFLLAGTAAIELCEAQMLCGRPEEASGTAQATIELIDHLRESPYLRGVIVTLSSHAAAGRPITLRLKHQHRHLTALHHHHFRPKHHPSNPGHPRN